MFIIYIIIFKVSYTFDAGPNAFLFILEKDLSVFMSELVHVFPSDKSNSKYMRGISSFKPDLVSKLLYDF